MYITFDYLCPDCGRTDERFVQRADMDDQKCDHDGARLVKLPPGTHTHFRFADTKLKE